MFDWSRQLERKSDVFRGVSSTSAISKAERSRFKPGSISLGTNVGSSGRTSWSCLMPCQRSNLQYGFPGLPSFPCIRIQSTTVDGLQHHRHSVSDDLRIHEHITALLIIDLRNAIAAGYPPQVSFTA
ncbi:hypothetical protein CPSG_04501 [Coccidioides posadasii str. Silveira]|uniref:Uncharacterized protein n=1 Tax=Coccidioides posadasii (strain RMSCC 757 / Silveira) TaxID=443226 RepID=E9D4G2_COCPS|nr:hypothetical protein CPSG_04501 [Coccidioides posadasii str. Silveira]